MTGAPVYLQDEVIDAEDFLDRIDNHKVLLEYGINMYTRGSDLLVLEAAVHHNPDISRSFASEV
jgi:hypothetical protein